MVNDDATDIIYQRISDVKFSKEQNEKIVDFYLWAHDQNILPYLKTNEAKEVISKHKGYVNESIAIPDFGNQRARLEKLDAEIYETFHDYDSYNVIRIPVKDIVKIKHDEHLQVKKQYVKQLSSHEKLNFYHQEKKYYRNGYTPHYDINVRWKDDK